MKINICHCTNIYHLVLRMNSTQVQSIKFFYKINGLSVIKYISGIEILNHRFISK